MTKLQLQEKTVTNYISEIMGCVFPELPKEDIRKHVVTGLITIINGLEIEVDLQNSGAKKYEASVIYGITL